jgi:nucleotide-binding universal stress UspA family protein
MQLQVKRILVPTDFSDPSRDALDMAIEFARRFSAHLTLFHASELPTYVFPDAVMPVTPQVMAELQRSSRQELERLASEVRAAGVAVDFESVVGPTDAEICHAAGEKHIDLIIMGTHGRTGLRHALLGSIAEKVVRRAPCPVLTVRPSAHAEHRV